MTRSVSPPPPEQGVPPAATSPAPKRATPPRPPGLFAVQGAAARRALRRLLATPLITLLSLLVIGFALMLPALGHVLLDNLRQFGHSNSGVPQISVFMAVAATPAEVSEIELRLKAAQAGPVRFVSRQEALETLKANPGMAEVIDSLPQNPLPDAFIVDPTVPLSQLDTLAQGFATWPKVAHVQLDSAWVKRFDAFLRLADMMVLLLGVVFAGGLMAVTFNTIRLQVLAQASEIEVCRLIGATDAFIRRPFLYFGGLQGLLGGMVAVWLTWIALSLLSGPVNELVTLYSGQFRMQFFTPLQALQLVATGGLLGWLGARISVGLALRSFD